MFYIYIFRQNFVSKPIFESYKIDCCYCLWWDFHVDNFLLKSSQLLSASWCSVGDLNPARWKANHNTLIRGASWPLDERNKEERPIFKWVKLNVWYFNKLLLRSLCAYESKNINSSWELNKSLDTTFAVPLPTSMIFCHTGDNTELRVANPNLLPQSRRTDSATGLITCKFHRAFSISKITNLLIFITKLTYGYFCKFTSYSRFSLRQVSIP